MQHNHRLYPGPGKFNLVETRTPEELCQTDGVSSDVTVLYQDSDVEEEFIGVEEQVRRDARLRANPYNTTLPIARNFTLPMHQQQFSNERMPADVFQMEGYHARRAQALSWGYQQDLADYEASLRLRGRPLWDRPPPPPPPPPPCPQPQQYQAAAVGAGIQNQMNAKQAPRRKNKGNRKSQGKTLVQEELPPPPPPPPVEGDGNNPPTGSNSQPTKSRRRGRRGGRGRRQQNERPADEVPKLDKGLEDELAQQMANHISNKSALTHSFSSLRLHVAGGGTMIILNDKEIMNSSQKSDLDSTPTAITEYRKDKLTSPSPVCDPPLSLPGDKSKNDLIGLPPAHKVAKPRGCGAFFPPQVLKQLQGEDPKTLEAPPGVVPLNGMDSMSPFPGQGHLNVERKDSPTSQASTTIAPVLDSPLSGALNRDLQSFHDMTKEMVVAGTGCFLPAYLQDCEDDQEGLPEQLEFAPEGILHDSGMETNEIAVLGDAMQEPQDSREDKTNVGELQKGSNPNKASGDIIDIVESHDFTTYTSPLHLEETLVDLKADRNSHEETEQKLINLQLENEELKSSINETSKLNSQIESLCSLNHLLMTLLSMERCKHQKRTWYQDFSPVGLTPNHSFNIPTIPEKTMIDKEVQVDEKKNSTSKASAPSTTQPSIKGSTRPGSSALGDGKNVGKESSKLERRNPGSTSMTKRTGGQIEKSKDSKVGNEISVSEKGRQDDSQMTKPRRQLSSNLTSTKSVVGGTSKKAPQTRSGDASTDPLGKKKKPGLLKSKPRDLVKKPSVSNRA